jgi:hypothetical protein
MTGVRTDAVFLATGRKQHYCGYDYEKNPFHLMNFGTKIAI